MYNLDPQIEDAFRRCALRRTPQRYAVLDYLMRHPVHPTADDIFRAINYLDPRASRATVYNNLHALIRAGLVREVVIEGKAARFDASIGRHYHFVCDGCGALEDIEWFELSEISSAKSLRGRTVREYEVILRGMCGKCAPVRIRPGAPHE